MILYPFRFRLPEKVYRARQHVAAPHHHANGVEKQTGGRALADKRILTTHAGSLPRPARLVELYATRAKGEEIDEAELVREGEAATR